MANRTVDASDLTDDDRVAVERLIDILRTRRTRGERTEDRAFARFWNKLSSTPATISEDEADEIAADARAFARGRV